MSIVMVELYFLVVLNFSLGNSVLFSGFAMKGIFCGAIFVRGWHFLILSFKICTIVLFKRANIEI